jgi:hypothetical protein
VLFEFDAKQNNSKKNSFGIYNKGKNIKTGKTR